MVTHLSIWNFVFKVSLINNVTAKADELCTKTMHAILDEGNAILI